MKFENTEVWGFGHALRGMRNPMESWSKSDSVSRPATKWDNPNYADGVAWDIGQNDMELATKLIRAGGCHRKFLRQIFVSVDITAPLYVWKELDTYKVGTVANSTSTMHKLANTPITMDCFEADDFNGDLQIPNLMYDICTMDQMSSAFVDALETLRCKYVETKDKRYWKELIRWLPESWLQKRTVTMSYENLVAMCSKDQRRFHRLNEWSGIDDLSKPNFISWARSLPYAQDFIFFDEAPSND